MPRDNRCMFMAHVFFVSVLVTVWEVCGKVCCVAAVVEVSGFLVLEC